jgi:hypothetical protein
LPAAAAKSPPQKSAGDTFALVGASFFTGFEKGEGASPPLQKRPFSIDRNGSQTLQIPAWKIQPAIPFTIGDGESTPIGGSFGSCWEQC